MYLFLLLVIFIIVFYCIYMYLLKVNFYIVIWIYFIALFLYFISQIFLGGSRILWSCIILSDLCVTALCVCFIDVSK